MSKTPAGGNSKNSRSGSDPVNRAIFYKELTEFLRKWMNSTPKKSGIKYEDFVVGLTDSIVQSSRTAPDGMRLAMLQMLTFELTERLSEIMEGTEVIIADQIDRSTTSTSFPAPTERNVDSEPIKTWEQPGSFSAESVLHKNGYSAAEGRLSESKRRAVLAQLFGTEQLLGIATNVDKELWGSASSPQRLYSMSRFIAWLARFQGNEKPAALKKWNDDLTWLKESFYKSTMGFKWPVVNNSSATVHQTKMRTPNAGFMKSMTPSVSLAAIVGSSALPRTEVSAKLWSYIKKHNLQDVKNRRMINVDSKLMPIFHKSQVSIFEVARLINEHLT